MKDVPEKIFLQVEDSEDEDTFKDLEGVTWGCEKINENDIEYIRKDLYDEAVAILSEQVPKGAFSDSKPPKQ